ncbi:MAG: hypothetical protein F4Y02_02330 [Chloroflexi bacterium]|nr:hypothetical protein [Chloroflexota bacterium]
MVAPIATQDCALASAFIDFGCLPDLLARLPGRSGDDPPDLVSFLSPAHGIFGPREWTEFFEGYPPNLDHIHYPQYEEEARLDPRLLVSVGADAWALAWRLRLVGPAGLSDAGRTLADIGRARPRLRRTKRDHAVLRRVLAEQVAHAWSGIGRPPIVPLLQGAARDFGRADAPGADPLPGLLLAEVAYLAELAHGGGIDVQAGRDRLAAVRREALEWLEEPEPGEDPSWYRIDLADAVNARVLDLREQGFLPGMTLTELRATASLLVFAGLLREVYPLGPVQCLAARP